ncbi:MAG: GNAT family protein [Flavobacteriaceae bacterium]|nr:GNAT family protein [Flavobacteriaceae bacterium]
MNLNEVYLRALEPVDLEILEKVENNTVYWKYSNQTEPFSRFILNQFIKQQQQDIFETRQKRFVISSIQNEVLGFIDLFDFEPLHRRAGVGLFVLEDFRNLGIAKQALKLLHVYAQKQLNMNTLFANVAAENTLSNRLFLSLGYYEVGLKKNWNFYGDSFHDEYLYQKIL